MNNFLKILSLMKTKWKSQNIKDVYKFLNDLKFEI